MHEQLPQRKINSCSFINFVHCRVNHVRQISCSDIRQLAFCTTNTSDKFTFNQTLWWNLHTPNGDKANFERLLFAWNSASICASIYRYCGIFYIERYRLIGTKIPSWSYEDHNILLYPKRGLYTGYRRLIIETAHWILRRAVCFTGVHFWCLTVMCIGKTFL